MASRPPRPRPRLAVTRIQRAPDLLPVAIMPRMLTPASGLLPADSAAPADLAPSLFHAATAPPPRTVKMSAATLTSAPGLLLPVVLTVAHRGRPSPSHVTGGRRQLLGHLTCGRSAAPGCETLSTTHGSRPRHAKTDDARQ